MFIIYIKLDKHMAYETRPICNSRNKAKENKAKENRRILFEGVCRLDEDCSICLSDIYGRSVYHTHCGHTYHTTCLRNQFEIMKPPSNMLCGMCRSKILDANANAEADTDVNTIAYTDANTNADTDANTNADYKNAYCEITQELLNIIENNQMSTYSDSESDI